MHELSIVMSIVDTAEIEADKAGVKQFNTIVLDIGAHSGVVLDALDFAWKAGVNGSVLENAERKINIIQAKAICVGCGSIFIQENIYDSCPECGSDYSELLQGKEMRIKELTFNI